MNLNIQVARLTGWYSDPTGPRCNNKPSVVSHRIKLENFREFYELGDGKKIEKGQQQVFTMI